jgi:hypothetical protein
VNPDGKLICSELRNYSDPLQVSSIHRQQTVSGATERLSCPAHVSDETLTIIGHTSGMLPADLSQTPVLRHIEIIYIQIQRKSSVNRGVIAGDALENKVLRDHIDNLATGNGMQLCIDIHFYFQLFTTRTSPFCLALFNASSMHCEFQ